MAQIYVRDCKSANGLTRITVDDDVLSTLSQFTLNTRWPKKPGLLPRVMAYKEEYAQTTLDRVITKAPKGSFYSHINGDPLDFHRENIFVKPPVPTPPKKIIYYKYKKGRTDRDGKVVRRCLGVHWLPREDLPDVPRAWIGKLAVTLPDGTREVRETDEYRNELYTCFHLLQLAFVHSKRGQVTFL